MSDLSEDEDEHDHTPEQDESALLDHSWHGLQRCHGFLLLTLTVSLFAALQR